MKPLQFQRDVFTWLGICPMDDQSKHKNFPYIVFGWLTVFVMSSIILSSSTAAINFGVDDLENALYAIFPTPAGIKGITEIASLIIYRQRVTSFFEKLQALFIQSK